MKAFFGITFGFLLIATPLIAWIAIIPVFIFGGLWLGLLHVWMTFALSSHASSRDDYKRMFENTAEYKAHFRKAMLETIE